MNIAKATRIAAVLAMPKSALTAFFFRLKKNR